jgi:hypothetical protein
MIKISARIFYLGLIMVPGLVKAEQTYLATTALHLIDIDRGYLAADYEYFSESLDVFDFASKLDSTFRPEEASSRNLSLAYRITPSVLVSYRIERASGVTSRDREPFVLESDVDGDSILIQWQAGEILDYSALLFGGYSQREQAPLNIPCYQYDTFTVGDCDTADFTFTSVGTGEADPALITSANEDRWTVGLSASKLLNSNWNIQHSIRFQSSDVSATVDSSFLSIDDPFLLAFQLNGELLGSLIDRLRSSFPQSSPWKERVLRYDLGLNWAFSDQWLLSNSLGYLRVFRSGFSETEGTREFESNVMFSASLHYAASPSTMFYLRGEVTKNYLLGIDPMLYNQRTRKFFDYPFGQISAGLMISF